MEKSQLIFNKKINEEPLEKLLTKKDVANYLNVSIKLIDKKVHHKEIPYIKIGRLVRFSIGEIQAWAREKRN